MGLTFSTPSHIFRSAQLSHFPINRVHQFICNLFQIPEHFGIFLPPLILFISYIFLLCFFQMIFRAIYDWIISRYCEWFQHHLKVYFFEHFITIQVIIVNLNGLFYPWDVVETRLHCVVIGSMTGRLKESNIVHDSSQ